MKQQLGSQEIKSILLDMLVFFHQFCEEHQLRYFLNSGTLLGAVRHQGFIPWDDDVDIIMPREDYEKFRRIYSPGQGKEWYVLHDYRTDATYAYPFLKMSDERTVLIPPGKDNISPMGIFIDIFPLDGMPQTSLGARVHMWGMVLLRRLAVLSSLHTGIKGRNPIKSAIVCIVKCIPLFSSPQFWNRMIDQNAVRFLLDGSRYAGNSVWGNVNCQTVRREAYASVTRLDFEGHSFYVPCGYDHYLTVCYGDYMTPPPPDKCHGIHIVDCYRKSAL